MKIFGSGASLDVFGLPSVASGLLATEGNLPRYIRLSDPPGFVRPATMPNWTAYYDRVEKKYFTDFDVTTLIPTEGVTVYVAENGSDLNSGALGSPKATISGALDVAEACDIVIRGGTYFRSDISILTPPDRSLIIRSYPGERVVFGCHGTNTWIEESGYPFVYSRPWTVNRRAEVFDSNELDAEEFPLLLAELSSVSSVASSPGSFYVDKSAGRLYVRAHNSRNLTITSNNRTICSRDGQSPCLSFLGVSGGGVLYLQGLTVISNKFGVDASTARTGGAGTLVLDGIKMIGPFASNPAIKVDSGLNIVASYLRLRGGLNDGVNLHGNGAKGWGLLKGCEISGLGSDQTPSNNAETVHDGCVMVSFGSKHSKCMGPVFGSIGGGTLHLIYGGQSSQSLGDGQFADYDCDFGALSACTMWLFGCKGESRVGLLAETFAELHVNSDSSITGLEIVSGSGQIIRNV